MDQPPSTSEIRRRLTLRPPTNPDVAARMEAIRASVIELGEQLEAIVETGCREWSLALTALEEACFWSIASVARSAANEPTQIG